MRILNEFLKLSRSKLQILLIKIQECIQYINRFHQSSQHLKDKMEGYKIQVFLDILMFLLLAIASISIIIEHSEYQMLIILIMFAYLFYFMFFRLEKYMRLKTPLVIHSLDQNKKDVLEAPVQEEEQKSEFVKDFERRQTEKSRIQNFKQFSEKDNSFTSNMNRSKRAQSFSKSSIIGQSSISNNDFNFLKAKQKANRVTREILEQKTQDMNNSYIRYMNTRENRKKEINDIRLEHITEETKQFAKTLEKFRLKYETVVKLTNNIEKLCINLAREFYQENIYNLRAIIGEIQANYNVRVVVDDLDGLATSTSRNSGQVQMDIGKVLEKLLSSKNYNPDFPQKKNQYLKQMVTPYYLASKVAPNTPQTQPVSSELLKSLCKSRLTLNSYFYNSKRFNLSGDELIQKLRTLSDYIEYASNSQKQYEIIPGSKLSQNQSQRLMTAFNVCLGKFNNLIGEDKISINYQTKSFFGWISKSQGRFVVKEKGSDYGHPYLYLIENVGGATKEEFYPEPGRTNGYSLFLIYFWALQLKETECVRKSPQLREIMTKFLELSVL